MSDPVGYRGDPPAAGDLFEFDCGLCRQAVSAYGHQSGIEARCPHCNGVFRVPRAGQAPDLPPDGQLRPGRAFSFTCTRCGSVLQGNSQLSGRMGKCPTCGVEFQVPHFNPATGLVDPVRIPDDGQYPTPMHLYAAAGDKAPHFVKGPDGTKMIECPVCSQLSQMAANSCSACGMPFTTEGLRGTGPVAGGSGENGLAVAALVLGIIAIPAFFIFVPAILAAGFGIVSVFRPRRMGDDRGRSMAIAGIVLGAISLGAAMVLVVGSW